MKEGNNKIHDIFPYFKTTYKRLGKYLLVDGIKVLNFASNDYLNLACDSEILQFAFKKAKFWGCSCSGSRFLNGTLLLHKEFEEFIAYTYKKDKAVIFPTGYLANFGFLSTFLKKSDIALTDREIHASIVDGIMYSGARIIRYKHLNLSHLKKLHSLFSPKLIIMEGVYSMSGDIQQKFELSDLKDSFIMLDEAHSMGVIGTFGYGLSYDWPDVDIIMATFSKSLASMGGFICANSEVLENLIYSMRPYIFTAALSPFLTAAAYKAFELLPKKEKQRKHLKFLSSLLIETLKRENFNNITGQNHIIGVVLKDLDYNEVFTVAKFIFDNGIWIHPIVYPAVPKNNSILRISLCSFLEKEDIYKLVEILSKARKVFNF